MFRKAAVAALALGLALSVAACSDQGTGTGGTTGSPAAGAAALPTGSQSPVDTSRKVATSTDRYSKVVVGIDSDPQDLLPFNVNSGSKPAIYHNFYESLFDLDNNEYVPRLAKSYKVVDDLHYDVTLYDYITDSAGNKITADDVVFSTQQLIKAGSAFKYDMFDSVKKIDEYTVEYTWKTPITQVGELEFPWCRTVIFSKKAYEAGNFATSPVGTGPYKVTGFTAGSKVTLEARDDYWQTDASAMSVRQQSNVQSIEYDVIAEPAQHVLALENGTIDYSEDVPAENLAEFSSGGKYADTHSVWLTAGSLLYTLTPNMSSSSPTNNEKLREAIFYAIDNNSAAQVTGTTIAATAFGTPFFSDYVKAWDTTPTYFNTYDPDKAKELIKESGYNGQTLVLFGGNDATAKNLLTIIQSFLVNVGLKVDIKSVDTAQVPNSAAAEGTWDLFLNTLGGGSQVGQWNRALSNTEYGNGMSLGFLKDDQLQQLFTAANTVKTHDDASMTAVHDYIVKNALQYAVVYPRLNIVHNSKIGQVYLREGEHFLPGASTYYLD
ncbi:MAG: ABC transporter substrate-binding protein [Propionicimonas sp.]|uniref:ABC transporter substrate-binding protein n=1 Tax=Propionicimonas sp. TaxID=1955623 RepID=UPI003D14FD58